MSVKNITKFQIGKPAAEVYEAFVNPDLIRNFWFSGSSCRWGTGKTVTLEYAEYGAGGFDIRITDAKPGKMIEFLWGEGDDENTVVFNFSATETDSAVTVVEVIESGWNESDPELTAKLVGNKEGWVYMLCCLKAYLENGVTTLRTGMIMG